MEYLENAISEDTFKKLIQRNNKCREKNNEIAQVINLAVTVVNDILHRLIDHLDQSAPNEHKDIRLFLQEVKELITYCNDIFKDIAFTYNSIVLTLTPLCELTKKSENTENTENTETPKKTAATVAAAT